MQRGENEQAGSARLPPPRHGFELTFHHGVELVRAVEVRLRQADAWLDVSARPDQATRLKLLTLTMELSSALQLLRTAREGQLPAPIARREAGRQLQRLQALRSISRGGACTTETHDLLQAEYLPPLLRLPLLQLAGLQAALTPRLETLAENTLHPSHDL
ncbi:hypothetical protein ACT6QH_04690 [Xanthobacter sp. TB0139]|uniref:hypothetical protein n=1 Tax=Xanthobacter sp. TB0139 TaxID=3459178 RepID=UPI0040390CC9